MEPTARPSAQSALLLPLVFVGTLVLLFGAGFAVGIFGDGSVAAVSPSPSSMSGTPAASGSQPASPSARASSAPSPTASASPTEPPTATFVGAGDIATCGGEDDEATAKLLDGIDGTVFTTGDNAYNSGTIDEFNECYMPSWGRHIDRTLPSAGNHDHRTEGLAGYRDAFGDRAGPPDASWYATQVGAWDVIVLDSNCGDVGGCGPSSPQGTWLAAQLAASTARCTVAIWHHPRFSSGFHGNDKDVDPFWRALHAAGVDVVLNGHDHDYERFAPQDPDGRAATDGIRQFVVGTGGAPLRVFDAPVANSVVRSSVAHGVLQMTLHQSSYDWQFISVNGTFSDHGSAACH